MWWKSSGVTGADAEPLMGSPIGSVAIQSHAPGLRPPNDLDRISERGSEANGGRLLRSSSHSVVCAG